MLSWTTVPQLDSPVVLAAFSGWNDAGDAASDALRHIARATGARPAGTIEARGHIDYQATRPQVEIVAGALRSVTWPTTEVSVSEESGLVTVLGPEPSFGWRSYCADLVRAIEALNPRLVVTLGALLGDVPHSREIRITGTATSDNLVRTLQLQPSRYEGPTGIVGVLHAECQSAAIPSASLWAPVPHYAASPPSPKAVEALVKRFAALTDIAVPTARLAIATSAWEEQVSTVVGHDDEVRDYVSELEAQHDRELAATADTVEQGASASPDEGAEIDPRQADRLAADIEAFLAEQGDDD